LLPLKIQLAEALRERSEPVLLDRGLAIPAASLYAAARKWVGRFRELGLGKGCLVASKAEKEAGFIALLIACLQEGLWLQPGTHGAPEGNAPPVNLKVIHTGEALDLDTARFDLLSRQPCLPESGGLVLATSGSTGNPCLFGISVANVEAVLDSHLPHMTGLDGSKSWSMLPWHHAFGLVIDLLPALLRGRAIYLPSCDPRMPMEAAAEIRQMRIDRLCSVPGYVKALDHSDPKLLDGLVSGVVGGAPCSAALANRLSRTHLQCGYGLTEASPGVSLGKPGEWKACAMGRPLGCSVRLETTGELAFKGPNAASWTWSEGRVCLLDPDRWVPTGDFAKLEPDGQWSFVGRATSAFKLDNGRWFIPEPFERRLLNALPYLEAAALLPHVKGGIILFIASNASEVSRTQLVAHLGQVASRLRAVYLLRNTPWPRSPKGETLRQRLPAQARPENCLKD
jgi:acyl-CoA synthetase (AMP-forming)/AMP-acid ligase II